MPPGIYGTRADLWVDLSLTAFCVLPVFGVVAILLARRRRLLEHRRMQVSSLAVMTLAVALLETDIRLQGGTGALAAHTFNASIAWSRGLLLVHIAIAVVTWLAWVYLVTRSLRSFRQTLPGTFSLRHRSLGRWIWLGQVFTAATGTLLYIVAYAL